MAVGVHRGLHLFMSQSVGDQQRGEAHFNQEARVAVPGIVDADFLHAGQLTAPLHLMPHEVLGEREQAVARLQSEITASPILSAKLASISTGYLLHS